MAETTTGVRIELDRARVDRTWGRLILGTTLLVAAVVVAVTALLLHAGAGLVDVMPVLIVLPLGAAYVLVTFGLSWRRLRRIAVPIELDGEGLTLRSSYGEVRAPWAAVTSVTVEPRAFGPCLRVRVAPEGCTSTVTQRAYRRILAAQGFRYALRMLATDADGLKAAFAEQSGGRVVLQSMEG